MSTRTINLDDKLYDYYRHMAFRDDPLLQELRDRTAAMPEANMQIAPEQGAFMAMLVALTGARRIVEIGTFTGYSALCMARALPEEGELIAMDTSEEWTAIASDFWCRAGVRERIDLRIGEARQSLRLLLESGGAGTVDMIFVDADKESYPEYFELGLRLLKANGVLLFDNVLWDGFVADSQHQEESTRAIRQLNQIVSRDPRVEMCMLPISDGLTLARKR